METLYKNKVKYSKARRLLISKSRMILKRLIVVSPSHLYVHNTKNYLSIHSIIGNLIEKIVNFSE